MPDPAADDHDPPADVPTCTYRHQSGEVCGSKATWTGATTGPRCSHHCLGADTPLDVLVGRFNALSDAAGNPGAPTPPGTPEGALSYALGEAERRARHRPGHTPLQARDVLAGLTELGWTLHPGLPHPAVLAQIHERLDRIEYVTENIAAAVDDPTPVVAEPWTCPECGQATLRGEGAPTEGDG